MSEIEKDKIASELIEMMIWALQQLNSGASDLPDKWKKQIQKAVFKSGHPATEEKRRMHVAMTTEALDYKLSRSQWKAAGRNLKGVPSYDQHLEKLAAKYGLGNKSSAYRIIRKHKAEAIRNILLERRSMVLCMLGLSKLAKNELDPDMLKILQQIRVEETNVSSVIKWLNTGKVTLKNFNLSSRARMRDTGTQVSKATSR